MHEEKELKDRILKKAEEMFFQAGFSKVTMGELASSLGMSKKTLYKYYTSKDQILAETIGCIKCEIDDFVDNLWANKELDFIEKLKTLMNFIGQNTSMLRGPLAEELQKSHPEIWDQIMEFRKRGALEKFSLLLKEGVKKGAFRKDLDQQIIVLVYLNAITGILNPEVLSQLPYTGNQVFESIIKIIMEGIMTDEGRSKYQSTKTANVKSKPIEEFRIK